MKFHYKYLDEFLGRQFKFKIKKMKSKSEKKGKPLHGTVYTQQVFR